MYKKIEIVKSAWRVNTDWLTTHDGNGKKERLTRNGLDRGMRFFLKEKMFELGLITM